MSERRQLLEEPDDDNTNFQKYPGKTPVMVRRDPRDATLPDLPKPKMMIPEDFTHAQLLTLIRQKLRSEKNSNTHLYLRYDGARDQALSYSNTVGQLHRKFAKSDGLLHVIYTSNPPEAPSDGCCCTII
ncbi:hypothetical protein EMCRGX_G018293 [Ephydatia muelleri]|eukprot:Em0012g706a